MAPQEIAYEPVGFCSWVCKTWYVANSVSRILQVLRLSISDSLKIGNYLVKIVMMQKFRQIGFRLIPRKAYFDVNSPAAFRVSVKGGFRDGAAWYFLHVQPKSTSWQRSFLGSPLIGLILT